jgi:hypothetical protein
MSGLSRLVLIFDLAVVAGCALFARAGYYELFVDVPGIHTGRWPSPWSMPKTAVFIMLAAAIVSMAAALLLVIVLRDPGAQRIARIVEVIALIVMVGAWVAWNVHFLSNAGRFG